MNTLKPITVLTQNFIEESSAVLYAAGSSAAVTFNFPSVTEADTLLLKNADIETLLIEYKREEAAAFTALPAQNCAGKRDIIINLPQNARIKILKISVTSNADVCFIEKIILAQTLLHLNHALSALTPGNYTRGGHHYLADGTLLNWTEFVKQTPALRLQNVDKQTKDLLLKLFKTSNFLTYIFYGSYDGGFCGQFAQGKPPAVSFERKTMLYSLDLSLLER